MCCRVLDADTVPVKQFYLGTRSCPSPFGVVDGVATVFLHVRICIRAGVASRTQRGTPKIPPVRSDGSAPDSKRAQNIYLGQCVYTGFLDAAAPWVLAARLMTGANRAKSKQACLQPHHHAVGLRTLLASQQLILNAKAPHELFNEQLADGWPQCARVDSLPVTGSSSN